MWTSLAIVLSIAFFTTDAAVRKTSFPFNDVTLPWNERVDDLVNRLTLQEMTDQMANGGRLTAAPAIERLGIADKITFVSNISTEEMVSYHAQATVAVVPSI